jgi:uncharacterized protein (DUF1697 family)
MTLDEITELDKELLAARYEAALTEEFGRHTEILIQSERFRYLLHAPLVEFKAEISL